jgi:hypothetical protein
LLAPDIKQSSCHRRDDGWPLACPRPDSSKSPYEGARRPGGLRIGMAVA